MGESPTMPLSFIAGASLPSIIANWSPVFAFLIGCMAVESMAVPPRGDIVSVLDMPIRVPFTVTALSR